MLHGTIKRSQGSGLYEVAEYVVLALSRVTLLLQTQGVSSKPTVVAGVPTYDSALLSATGMRAKADTPSKTPQRGILKVTAAAQ